MRSGLVLLVERMYGRLARKDVKNEEKEGRQRNYENISCSITTLPSLLLTWGLRSTPGPPRHQNPLPTGSIFSPSANRLVAPSKDGARELAARGDVPPGWRCLCHFLSFDGHWRSFSHHHGKVDRLWRQQSGCIGLQFWQQAEPHV
jgi:hypothetical protein